MIDHENKLVFIHAIKTGGTSIEVCLSGDERVGQHFDEEGKPTVFADLVAADKRLQGFFPLGRHCTAKDNEDYLVSIGENPEDYRWFTVVRDPIDQAISSRDYVDRYWGKDCEKSKNSVQGKVRNKTAMCNTEMFVHTLRFEHLEADFLRLMGFLGVRCSNLPKANVSPTAKEDKPTLTDKEKEFIMVESAYEGRRYGYAYEYVAIVTAKKDSRRTPRKNMLPINGIPLFYRSVRHAKMAGLPVVVISDCEETIAYAVATGTEFVRMPEDIAALDHKRQLDYALEKSGFKPTKGVVLFQPTSPFREEAVTRQCVALHRKVGGTVATGYTQTVLLHSNEKVTQKVINGNLFVYEVGNTMNNNNAEIVDIDPFLTVEIDEPIDYTRAARWANQMHHLSLPVHAERSKEIMSEVREKLGDRDVHIVMRDTEHGVPADVSRVFVNHCCGYDGGDCDAVFVVANDKHELVVKDPRFVECIEKAKVILVRDHQYFEHLKNGIPTHLHEKLVKFDAVGHNTLACSESGALACYLFATEGYQVTTHGAQGDPTEYCLRYQIGTPHYMGADLDFTVLNQLTQRYESTI